LSRVSHISAKLKEGKKRILLGNVLKFLRDPDFSAENSGKILIE